MRGAHAAEVSTDDPHETLVSAPVKRVEDDGPFPLGQIGEHADEGGLLLCLALHPRRAGACVCRCLDLQIRQPRLEHAGRTLPPVSTADAVDSL